MSTPNLTDRARHLAAQHRLQDHGALADLLDELVDAIDAAPHDFRCAIKAVGKHGGTCTCWKSNVGGVRL